MKKIGSIALLITLLASPIANAVDAGGQVNPDKAAFQAAR